MQIPVPEIEEPKAIAQADSSAGSGKLRVDGTPLPLLPSAVLSRVSWAWPCVTVPSDLLSLDFASIFRFDLEVPSAHTPDSLAFRQSYCLPSISHFSASSSSSSPPLLSGVPTDHISITIKCLKPPLTYTLDSISLSEPVSTLKQALSASNPTAPPPEVQRLLLKGKALADNKLLKEYDGIIDGVIVNLNIKAGWTPGATTPNGGAGLGASSSSLSHSALSMEDLTKAPGANHSRTASSSSIPSETPPADPTSPSAIPSLTLSMPSSSQQTPMPINTTQVSTVNSTTSAHYHDVVAQPEFWCDLYAFAKARFLVDSDAEEFLEAVLRGEKSKMSASDVAKARDATGVFGMAGV